jgi:4a-hydroxytetrahydrobiopterin dehydratase
MATLNQAELGRKLDALSGWTLKGGRIEKSYQLGSFPAALEFVQQAAALAEAEQQRPDIVIRASVVTLSLGADEESGVSEKDLELASKLEQLPRS